MVSVSEVREVPEGGKRNIVLAGAALILVAAVASVTWLDIRQDLEATKQGITHRSQALLETMETVWVATLLDASNSAASAASMIESPQWQGIAGKESRLHDELQRELPDDQGTARLVFTSPDGTVLASSAEYPVAPLRLNLPPQARSIEIAGGGRPFHLGAPEKSIFDGETVLPFWCEVRGPTPGWMRSELRVGHLALAYGPVSKLFDGSVSVFDAAANRMLLSLPLDGSRPHNELERKLDGLSGQAGAFELKTEDGLTHIYTWRRMTHAPILIVRGVAEDALLAPVMDRAEVRAAVAGLLCAGVCLLGCLLARYLGRLDTTQRQATLYEQRYWGAMETSSIGVVVLDLAGQWLYANPKLCDMLGYTKEEILAGPSSRHTPASYRENRDRLFGKYSARAIGASSGERPMLHKDGHEVWVSVTGTVLGGSDGSPPLVITHARDITEERAARLALHALNRDLEERVERRTRELRQANADLEAFSYSAAHDLRSPLGRIVAYVDLLARETSTTSERAQRWIGSIRRQAVDMNDLIESLLALSRAARADLAHARFSMQHMVAELRGELSHSHNESAAVAEWRVAPLPDAWGDAALMRVALTNLLDNALKYSRNAAQPCIEVGSFPVDEPGMAGYFVRDNGAGFDMSDAQGLFTPFKRMHLMREFEGNGIGLAIVHRVVTRMGGRIWAHAERGHGATFFLTLPSNDSRAGVHSRPVALLTA